MKRDQRPDQQFQDLLDGRSASASAEEPELQAMLKLTAALRPAVAEGPNPQFRRRLRSELLAQAASTPQDVFAAALAGPLEAPAEMRQLVAVAAALEPASLPVPRPAFRYQLRASLIEQARNAARPSAVAWLVALNTRMRRSLRTVAATGMAAMLLLGSSIALAASQSAIPGDALYGVKRLHETARLIPLSGPEEGRARLAYARERLDEVAALKDRGSVDEALYIGTLDDMDELTTSGATTLLDHFRATGERASVDSVASFAHLQIRDLTELLPQLPPGVRPAARDSLAIAERAADEVERTLSDCVCPGDDLFPVPTGRIDAQGTTGQPCICATPDGDNGGDQEIPPGPQPPRDDEEPPTESDDPRVNLPDDLPDDIEEGGEDLIDDILDVLDDPLPSLPPSPLPSELPGVGDLGL